jgi:hypothetical protein
MMPPFSRKENERKKKLQHGSTLESGEENLKEATGKFYHEKESADQIRNKSYVFVVSELCNSR